MIKLTQANGRLMLIPKSKIVCIAATPEGSYGGAQSEVFTMGSEDAFLAVENPDCIAAKIKEDANDE